MRITFVADYRSPIAQGWIEAVSLQGFDVRVISSRPVPASGFGSPAQFVPLGPEAVLQRLTSRAGLLGSSGLPKAESHSGRRGDQIQGLLRAIAPHELGLHRRALRRALESTNPDIVHALRIPFEGMATSDTWRGPVVVSIWGNDLTLHAPRNRAYRRATRRTLQRVDALHTDCARDQRLALSWGFDSSRPTLVVPGSGGIRLAQFSPGSSPLRGRLGIPATAPVVLNARGLRAYTRMPEFFAAIELLMNQRADVHVLITGMAGNSRIESALARMKASDRIHLLPHLNHAEMPDVYRAADISLSLTTHDGTPNTLLESMSTGVFPIVSPVESVLEWIDDGVNGYVVSPIDPSAIAAAIFRAIDEPDLRHSAARINARITKERADRETCGEYIRSFYNDVWRSTCGRGGT